MSAVAVEAESLFAFLERLLRVEAFPDHAGAWNGLQVEGPTTVGKLAVAVDASMATIRGAAEVGADLMLVHHGLFWDPDPRLVGPRRARLAALLAKGIGVYAVHLPLDAHPEVGNASVLAREVGIRVEGPFGAAKGVEIGCWGRADGSREAFRERVAQVVEGPVRLVPGGPEAVRRVAVVTGAGGGFIREAASGGFDTLLTGEGPHHTFVEAMEYGVNVLYAGHYATETWGVRAVAERIEAEFGLPWAFVDVPSGM
jgi:dinuclear metal center YbgI/SA1388 family protein